ncbi:MAG: 50S ribosomal protein L30 [Chloroflexi bacterium]|jgi:large subunit ribosomal protein L30|nr:50S ribosomal protein L30 [Chloroflexota bacterium]
MAKLRIKQVRSLIGYERDQRRTVRALGLRRIRDSVIHEDSPTIMGMLHKVRHLVEVEPASEEEQPRKRRSSNASA